MAASLPACQSDAAWKSAAPASAHARCTYGSEEGGDAEMREEGKRAAVSRRSHPNRDRTLLGLANKMKAWSTLQGLGIAPMRLAIDHTTICIQHA